MNNIVEIVNDASYGLGHILGSFITGISDAIKDGKCKDEKNNKKEK